MAAPDGTLLLERRWRARGRWGTVVVVHGLSEHSGRYDPHARYLAEAGLEVIAYDQRGHGASAGARTHLERFTDLLDDLEDRLEEAAAEGLPVALLGHSFGGLVCLRYAVDGREPPRALVLSAPALDADIPAWKRWAARGAGTVLPGYRIPNDLRPEQLSRDPAVGEAYLADPLVSRSTSARFALESLRAMEEVRSRLRALRIPTLVLHGGADTIVPPQATAPLAELPTVDRLLYPALRHEILNEPEGEQVLETVVAWLRDHLP